MYLKRLIIILMYCLITLFLYGQDFYMHINGQKHSYEVSATKILVKSETLNTEDIKNAIQKTVANNTVNVYDLQNRLTMVDIQNASKENILELQKQWNIKEYIIYASPVLLNETGREIGGFTNQVFVRLKSTADYSLLEKAAGSYQIKSINPCGFDELTYLLTLANGAEKNAMQTANELHESGLFEYAEPNLIQFLRPATNDSLYAEQWGLKNTGQSGGIPGIDINVEQAWGITTGSSNIKIAILDVGVELNHPDLINNLLTGYDATGNNNNGAVDVSADPYFNGHGTACAGIAAASANNTIGIAGVAYGCRILPVRIATTSYIPITQTQDLINAFNWARQNADVISLSYDLIETSTLTTAITNAINLGRNNLGCVVVACSQNYGNNSVTYPANLPDVIAVGAIDRYGNRANFINWGSNYGEALDVVAPGDSIYTTDLSGSAGYYPYNSYCKINGTSAATPHVAGIAALILSRRPDLTQDQVRQAIESTCTKLSGYTFTNNPSVRPNGEWNDEVGYGLVNAYEAVNSVVPFISGTDPVCYTGSAFTLNKAPAGTIYWKVSNTNIFTVNSTGNPTTVTGIGSGTGNVILSAHTGSANGPQIASKTISPCLPPTIYGPTLVCSGSPATFTVYNSPAGFSWDKSTNLSMISSGNSITVYGGYNASGPGWVSIKINNVELVKHDVWVGPPAISYMNGPTTVQTGVFTTFSTILQNYTHSATTGYQWSVNPSNGCTVYSMGYYASISFGIGSYEVICQATNACGTGVAYIHEVVSGYRSSPSPFSFYPNPVNDILYVEINNQSEQTTNKNSTSVHVYDILLYDGQGNLKRRATTKGGKVELNVSSLPNGFYYLHIYDEVNNNHEIHQIMVRH